MKDEIKEILEYLHRCEILERNQVLTNEEIKILLQHITNLQEENKELKKKISFNEKSRRKMQQSLMEQIETYKSRNEKAIEYINKEIQDMPRNGCSIRMEETKNILQGVD